MAEDKTRTIILALDQRIKYPTEWLKSNVLEYAAEDRALVNNMSFDELYKCFGEYQGPRKREILNLAFERVLSIEQALNKVSPRKSVDLKVEMPPALIPFLDWFLRRNYMSWEEVQDADLRYLFNFGFYNSVIGQYRGGRGFSGPRESRKVVALTTSSEGILAGFVTAWQSEEYLPVPDEYISRRKVISVMGITSTWIQMAERKLRPIRTMIAKQLFDGINEYACRQGLDLIRVDSPVGPMPRYLYNERGFEMVMNSWEETKIIRHVLLEDEAGLREELLRERSSDERFNPTDFTGAVDCTTRIDIDLVVPEQWLESFV